MTLAHRSESFIRAKMKNREMINRLASKKHLEVLMNSSVIRIHTDYVELDCCGDLIKRRNDAVMVCTGGILPTDFLRSIGINIETKFGTV